MTDCPEATRRIFTVATAGHVDHGKTSLLKALTGVDCDRLKEEKERQMTVDLGFAHLVLSPELSVGFIDVPGHGKFLKNMLAGVGGIDLALLLVAADEGPMPQTRQHVRILSLLGVRTVVLVISKIDLVASSQAMAALDAAKRLIEEHQMVMAGYQMVSATRPSGIEELKVVLGKALSGLPSRESSGAAFLPIDRAFVKSGFGRVVTGTLVRGRLSSGDHILIEPGSIAARIRGMQTAGCPVTEAQAGQRLAVNLVLKESRSLERGQVIVTGIGSASNSLMVLLTDPVNMPKSGPRDIRIYHGTAERTARIRWLEPLADQCSDLQSMRFIAQLKVLAPVVAEVGDRFIIRLEDDIVIGGIVLLYDRPRWLNRAKACVLAGFLYERHFARAVHYYLECCPQQMVRETQIARLLPAGAREKIVNEMVEQGLLVRLGEFLLCALERQRLSAALVDSMQEWIRSSASHDQAVPLSYVRAHLGPAFALSAFQVLIQEEIGKCVVTRMGDRLLLPAQSPGALPVDNWLREEILSALSAATIIEIAELARRCRVSVSQIKAILKELSNVNGAAIVNYDFACSVVTINAAHRVLDDLWREEGNISPSRFKDLVGVSRKYAMAILAYFDDQHITRRTATGRLLLRHQTQGESH